MAKRRCDPRLFTGNVVYRYLATTGVHPLAHSTGEKSDRYNRVYQSAFSTELTRTPTSGKPSTKTLDRCRENAWADCARQQKTRIPKSIYEGIQTINRNLVCMLELQINAYWSHAPSHFVLLNAQKLRDTQHMMQQILLSLVHALYEGNPQPVLPIRKN